MNHQNSRHSQSQSSRQSHLYHMAEEIYQLGYEHGYDDGADDERYDDEMDQEDMEYFFDDEDFDYDGEDDYGYDHRSNFDEGDHPRDAQGRFISKSRRGRSQGSGNSSSYNNTNYGSSSGRRSSGSSNHMGQGSGRRSYNSTSQRGQSSTGRGSYNSNTNRSNSSSGSNRGAGRRGFAAMSKAKRTEIARMGGRASHGGGRSTSNARR